MQIKVLFFGVLKDLAGRRNDTVTLPDGATVADLLAHFAQQYPRLQTYLPAVATAVNEVYSARGASLRHGDEVGLLPPVSGGTSGLPKEAQMVPLVHGPIDTRGVLETIKQPEDGAVAVFEGIVRNHSRGHRTLFLEYEAYEPLAVTELHRLTSEAREKFPIRAARIVHRLGRLEIGETSVLVAVAAAHRGPAFDACRWLIDTLKRTVPIWKREHFEGGAVWADGEPFPENLPGAPGAGGASK